MGMHRILYFTFLYILYCPIHSLSRYKKDIDGFLKLNMVRFETVEVTKEIMKNMATKPQSLRRSQRTSSSRNRKDSAPPERECSSPIGSILVTFVLLLLLVLIRAVWS